MIRRALVVALLAVAWLPAVAAAQSRPAYVFWKNPQSGTIGRGNLDGSGVNRASSPGSARVSRCRAWRSTAPTSWADGLNVGRATSMAPA